MIKTVEQMHGDTIGILVELTAEMTARIMLLENQIKELYALCQEMKYGPSSDDE